MPDAIPVLAIASVNHWLTSSMFATAARTPQLVALVWWQGGEDVSMSQAEYAASLRQVIAIARSFNAQLPVRIIELPRLPDRAHISVAQSEVAQDPNVVLIPTADLVWADNMGHFTEAGYREVRERIYRSLGF